MRFRDVLSRLLLQWKLALLSVFPAFLIDRLFRAPFSLAIYMTKEPNSPLPHDLRLRAKDMLVHVPSSRLSETEGSVHALRVLERPRSPFVRFFSSVDIYVSNSCVFIIEKTLPLRAWPKILRILDMERMRLGLFDEANAHSFVYLSPHPRAASQFVAAMAFIKRDELDEILQAMTRSGLPLGNIFVEDRQGVLHRAFPYPRKGLSRHEGGFFHWSRRLVGTLLALAILSAAAVGGMHQYQAWRQAVFLDNQIRLLSERKNRLQKAISEREKIFQAHARLLARRSQRPLVAVIIDELSKRLPRDAYLDVLKISGRTVHIEGSAQSAARLIRLLVASPLFRKASFTSPITQEPVTGRERFSMQIELAGPVK